MMYSPISDPLERAKQAYSVEAVDCESGGDCCFNVGITTENGSLERREQKLLVKILSPRYLLISVVFVRIYSFINKNLKNS